MNSEAQRSIASRGRKSRTKRNTGQSEIPCRRDTVNFRASEFIPWRLPCVSGYNPPIMRQFDTETDPPEAIRAALTARDHAKNAQIEAIVRGILDDVKVRGDAAVLDYTRRFDWPEAATDALALTQPQLAAQFEGSPGKAGPVSETDWNILDGAMTNAGIAAIRTVLGYAALPPGT